jgi:hypothetical protein
LGSVIIGLPLAADIYGVAVIVMAVASLLAIGLSPKKDSPPLSIGAGLRPREFVVSHRKPGRTTADHMPDGLN